MRKATIVILMLVWSTCFQMAYAQDIKKNIREHYNAIKEMIASYPVDEDYPVHECYKVKIVQNLPGSGRHEEDVQIYYGEREDDEIYPTHYLEFAWVSYNFSARKYYEEYLFDKKGNLTFVYASSSEVADGMEHEMRFYFNNGKLYDAQVKSRKVGDAEYAQEYSGNNLPKKYSEFYKQYVNYAAKLHRLFEAVDGAAHL